MGSRSSDRDLAVLLVLSLHSRPSILVNLFAVRRWRISRLCYSFLGSFETTLLANDFTVSERRALYSITSEVYVIPDSAHCTIFRQSARDITRRMRVALHRE